MFKLLTLYSDTGPRNAFSIRGDCLLLQS